jgi:hypothetical protein
MSKERTSFHDPFSKQVLLQSLARGGDLSNLGFTADGRNAGSAALTNCGHSPGGASFSLQRRLQSATKARASCRVLK